MKYTGNLKLKKPEGSDVVDIDDLNDNADVIDREVSKKVDKVAGKDLSDENYTLAEKTKLAGIEAGANKYIHPVTHSVDIIVENKNKRFVSDVEKNKWNSVTSKASKTYVDNNFQRKADNELVIGKYKLKYNSSNNSLDIEVV